MSAAAVRGSDPLPPMTWDRCVGMVRTGIMRERVSACGGEMMTSSAAKALATDKTDEILLLLLLVATPDRGG